EGGVGGGRGGGGGARVAAGPGRPMATASRAATRASVLLTPEATPTSLSSTAVMTVVVNGATVIAMPSPITTIGGKKVVQYEPLVPGTARSSRPAAVTSGPTTSGGRGPKRSASAPVRRESAPIRSAKGRYAAPVAVAE